MSDFICPEGAVMVALSGQRGMGKYTIIDIADAKDLLSSGFKWHLGNNGYVARYETKKTIIMHREIMSVAKDLFVDHIDGDILNNRRSNLRIATHSENMRNRKMAKSNKSGFKGVYARIKNGRTIYLAEIQLNSKKFTLGTFSTPQSAHDAYIEASKRLHKEFSRTS